MFKCALTHYHTLPRGHMSDGNVSNYSLYVSGDAIAHQNHKADDLFVLQSGGCSVVLQLGFVKKSTVSDNGGTKISILLHANMKHSTDYSTYFTNQA
jgi:hypothetical protein